MIGAEDAVFGGDELRRGRRHRLVGVEDPGIFGKRAGRRRRLGACTKHEAAGADAARPVVRKPRLDRSISRSLSERVTVMTSEPWHPFARVYSTRTQGRPL